MSENYHVRLGDPEQSNPFFDFFSRIILQAWEACRFASREDQRFEQPMIVTEMKCRLAEGKSKERHNDPESCQGAASRPANGFPVPMSMGIDGNMPLFGMDVQSLLGGYPDMTVQPMMDFDLGLLDWSTVNWNPMLFPG